MDNSFLASIQKLEAMAFFSGYALVYTVMLFFWGNEQQKGKFTSRIISLLPVSYAFIGVLFLGFQLKRLYPDYSWEHVRLTIQQPYLIGWGILSIAFLIPALKKQPVISLLHSCTFFYFIAADLFGLLIAKSADNDMVKNDMKVLAASVILNIGVLALIILLFTLDILYKKYKLRRI
ncbi:hypothetical protein [Mucilaginibacter xinganensis]|uniref:Uncharacterized protein n=1 Tax=Mucilaginibacter xinganensis TaxID=1234841 RepID=A0A223NTH8_9SPHI|nr:hypothetical protein [Mucilaginibacter xinganensis]ASU33070.1 hypothetical protein MuYL_1170 [Mucilaginibacter xinganensis]